MSSDLTEILVDNQILMEDIGKTVTDPYMAFVNLLPLDDCRYAVYLVNYEINYSKEESLVFILWCPASASLRNKMTYASYKDYFRALLIGINKEFIVDSIDTFEDRTTFAQKIGGPLVNSLEGVPLK
ncbi:cofilin-2-like [Hyperolius riggenbachi]|uniref:cofilin-2-like n=1 Tax=Hyperolius riggenbachi TaxID=752182 RepID=UPI0035A2E639